MTNSELFNLILLATQILTLIALVIYVVKTWHIASATKVAAGVSALSLQEMKEARDQEIAPYVVVYFDMPRGEHFIYLVVKNIGRSIARDVKLQFSPRLIGISQEDFTNLPMIRDGIASMPPNHEIRTLVDSTVAFFNEKSDRPLTYQVNVSFYGGLKDTQRLSEHVLDLTAYKGLSWITRRGLHELTNEVEKISRNTERIGKELSELNEYLTEGVHIRNAVLTSTILQSDEGSWQRMVSSKLLEFKHLWLSMYQGNLDKLLQPFLGKLRNRLIQLADQLLVMISTSPPGVDDKIKDVLVGYCWEACRLGCNALLY